MTAVRLLVTGASGQVGRAVDVQARREGYQVLAPSRQECNLADAHRLQAYLETNPCEAIINCGAYTAVDRAQSEPALANRINHAAAAQLARHANACGIPLVQVSTDYVFDGLKPTAYTEVDAASPLGIYGASKWAAERALSASGARYAVVRSAWIISPDGANFMNTMLRLAQERPTVSVVDDQFGCPTAAADLAAALLMITEALLVTDLPSGIWHFVNSGRASWYELAQYIFLRAAENGRQVPRLYPIMTADYPTAAARPANSELSTLKFQRDFGSVRDWHAAMDDVLSARLGRIDA